MLGNKTFNLYKIKKKIQLYLMKIIRVSRDYNHTIYYFFISLKLFLNISTIMNKSISYLDPLCL